MKKVSALIALLMMGVGISQASFAQNEMPASAAQAQSVLANAEPVHIKAKIVGIDRAARIVTLRGPRGNDLDIGLSKQVDNFD